MNWKDKFVAVLAIICLAGVAFLSTLSPLKRYRLPNGDVVECAKMVETSKGNFYLSGCDNNSEYYVQGTVEIIGG